MRHIMCEVRRSEISSIATKVLPWDIPVLEFLHGVENVIVHGECDEHRVIDGPQQEFTRMENAYGRDPETNQSYVSQVYGNGGIGIAKLAQFMDEQGKGDRLAS